MLGECVDVHLPHIISLARTQQFAEEQVRGITPSDHSHAAGILLRARRWQSRPAFLGGHVQTLLINEYTLLNGPEWSEPCPRVRGYGWPMSRLTARGARDRKGDARPDIVVPATGNRSMRAAVSGMWNCFQVEVRVRWGRVGHGQEGIS
jgi:hypothetical protein